MKNIRCNNVICLEKTKALLGRCADISQSDDDDDDTLILLRMK
jgi:hypothetical protein